MYQLNLSVDPSGSGVAIIVNNGATNGAFAEGTPMTIRATASSGYSFWKWTAGGITVVKIPEFSFNMPAEDMSLVANFSQNPNAPTNGLPSGNDVPITTTQMSWTAPAAGVTPSNYKIYLYSEADGYTNPIDGYDGVETTNTFYNLSLNMNTSYMARVLAEYDPDFKGFSEPLEWYFKTENIITYNIELMIDPAGAGIVLIQNNGATKGDFEAGTELNITATPESGYTFWKWTLDGVTISTTANFVYTVPAEDKDLLAHFYQDPTAPTNGTPSGTDVSAGIDVISWTAPVSGSAPTNYIIYIYTNADMFVTPIVNGVTVTGTQYSGLDLEYGVQYKVQVYSNFDPEAKSVSAALTWLFTTEEGSLEAPLDLTVTDASGLAQLDWTASAGADSYKIYSSTDPYADFATWNYETEVVGITTWKDPNTTEKKFYRIKAAN